MELEILGPLVARRNGLDVTPAGAQQRRLLAALTASWPGAVSVDVATELLWPNGAPSTNALQATVSKLRRVLAPVELAFDGRGYALGAEAVSTDRRRFESHVAEARAVAETDPAAAIAHFDAAITLVRGDALADLADAEHFDGERTRLQNVVDTVVVERLEAHVACGRHLAVVAELEQLVTERPLDEHVWALLMRAQYASGRQADALRTFQRARRILAEELGLEPGPELTDIERRVLDHDRSLEGGVTAATTGDVSPLGDARPDRSRPTSGSRGRGIHLPVRNTSFVGRDGLLDALAADLDAHRLVTLLGPGGVGKTTTAIRVIGDSERDPAHFVDLSAVGHADPDGVVAALAASLGLEGDVRPDGRTDALALDRVIDWIGSEPVVLLIDNCEHVIDAVARIARRIVESCLGAVVVATSREVLGVPGEHVVPVPPLSVDDAADLFVARAVSADPVGDQSTIREIVDRLDRLPLAIELAAARTRSMGVGDLLDRLDDRFATLSSGPRTVDPRQQTLRGVVDWSHALLDEAEQKVFRRLSVFAGGATLRAAEAVCSDSGADGEGVAPREVGLIIERLIDKSLLYVDRGRAELRYRMLETVAEYAAARLRSSDEIDHVLLRHARYFADFVKPALRGTIGSDQATWLGRLDAERDNVRVALDAALVLQQAQLALDLTAPLGWYFYMLGQADIGAARLSEALGCPGPTVPADRALALALYGWSVSNGPDIQHAVDAVESALALVDRIEDPWVEALVRNTHTMVQFFRGDIGEASRGYAAAHDAARRSGDAWAMAITELVHGEILQFSGLPDDAEEAFLAAADSFEATGDLFGFALALTEAAETYEMSGRYDEAADLLQRGLDLAADGGFSSHPLAMRARLGNLEALRSNLDAAERHHLAVLAEDSGQMPWLRTMSLIGLSTVERRRGRPQIARKWLDEAAAMRRNEVVPLMRTSVLTALGYTADLTGNASEALAFQRESLDLARTMPTPRVVANAVEGMAGALAVGPSSDGHEVGAQLLGHADALRRTSGGPMPPGERFDVDRAEGRLRGALGDERFERAFAAGRHAGLDDIVGRATR